MSGYDRCWACGASLGGYAYTLNTGVTMCRGCHGGPLVEPEEVGDDKEVAGVRDGAGEPERFNPGRGEGPERLDAADAGGAARGGGGVERASQPRPLREDGEVGSDGRSSSPRADRAGRRSKARGARGKGGKR